MVVQQLAAVMHQAAVMHPSMKCLPPSLCSSYFSSLALAVWWEHPSGVFLLECLANTPPAMQALVSTVYRGVIDDVCAKVKPEFIEGGIDECVRGETQTCQARLPALAIHP